MTLLVTLVQRYISNFFKFIRKRMIKSISDF